MMGEREQCHAAPLPTSTGQTPIFYMRSQFLSSEGGSSREMNSPFSAPRTDGLKPETASARHHGWLLEYPLARYCARTS